MDKEEAEHARALRQALRDLILSVSDVMRAVHEDMKQLDHRVAELEQEMDHLGDQCALTLDAIEGFTARVKASVRDN